MATAVMSAARLGGDGLLLPARRRFERPTLRLGKRRRARIEALIMHLIALLDAADGDPDREPEPECSVPAGDPAWQYRCDMGPGDADDEEASLQPVVMVGARRPAAALWWG